MHWRQCTVYKNFSNMKKNMKYSDLIGKPFENMNIHVKT